MTKIKNYITQSDKDYALKTKKDILFFTPPLFCFDNLADNLKNKIDKVEKSALFDLIIAITKRAKEVGLNKAMQGYNDYKERKDWQETYGGNKSYYSIRLKNNSAFRVCKTRINVDDHPAKDIFQIYDLVNEKN